MPHIKLLQSRHPIDSHHGSDAVVLYVQLFQPRHVFEWSQRFKLIFYRLEHLDVGMALPSLVHLLQLVVRNVEVLERGHCKISKLANLVVLEVQVLEFGEVFLLGENCDVLDLVLAQVQPN